MSFTKKRIDVTLALATGKFGESGANTVTLSGLRVQALLKASPGDAQPEAFIRVFGVPEAITRELTSVGLVNAALRTKNKLLVQAGDDETGMATVYDGSIVESWGDYRGMPDIALTVTGVAGAAAGLKPVSPTSYQGQADVATILKSLADIMGFAFEDNNVQVQLANPYFPGTALAQARACVRAADIHMVLDCGTMAIWPKFGFRLPQEDIPLVSTATGMVGYPVFSSNAIMVRSLFNPHVRPGGKVEVQSSLPMASGTWLVSDVTHTLESETPNGQWFTDVLAKPVSTP